MQIILQNILPVDLKTGTIRLKVISAGAVRVFRTDGDAELTDYVLDLSDPKGELDGLVKSEDKTVTLWLEGLSSANEVILRFVYENAAGEEIIADELHLMIATSVDLDIDSNNNNVIEESEDIIENDSTKPGKIIMAAYGDADGDGIPDFADGFNLNKKSNSDETRKDDTSTHQFTPIVLQIPEFVDTTKATLRINYSASFPGAVTSINGIYTPEAGNLRIWTNNDKQRDKRTLKTGGDFVAPSSTNATPDYTLAELGFSINNKNVTFYVEGINVSAAQGDQQIRIVLLPDGKEFIGSDVVRITVIKLDLATKGHDFVNPKTGEIDVLEKAEETVGAFVHYNIDNDNSNISSDGTPIVDKDEDGSISGENDLKNARIDLEPILNKGIITIKRSNTKLRIWKNSSKGSRNLFGVLVDDNEKKWNLSIPAERTDFMDLKDNLWIEGYEEGVSYLAVEYMNETNSYIMLTDKIKYIAIGATCGRQPYPTERNGAETTWENLVHCEWSITGPATEKYNCIAWSVGETNVWYNDTWGDHLHNVYGIDADFGNGDGIMQTSELDAFYDAKGYEPTATGPADAEIIYYSKYHAAKKKKNCTDGASQWIVFESKTGRGSQKEHVWDQLQGVSYGVPIRYYKSK